MRVTVEQTLVLLVSAYYSDCLIYLLLYVDLCDDVIPSHFRIQEFRIGIFDIFIFESNPIFDSPRQHQCQFKRRQQDCYSDYTNSTVLFYIFLSSRYIAYSFFEFSQSRATRLHGSLISLFYICIVTNVNEIANKEPS